MRSSHALDQLDIAFDDPHAVANAGLLLPATLAERLGIEQATDQLIDLGDRPGAAHPGRKLLTLVHAMVAGGDCIDDAELLRCGPTGSVLGHRVMAPSTVGTFLRASPSATSASSTGSPARSWPGVGGGCRARRRPDDHRRGLHHLRGARLPQAGRRLRLHPPLGYHPLLATRAGTGEVLHARLRTGRANTARGIAPLRRRAGRPGCAAPARAAS